MAVGFVRRPHGLTGEVSVEPLGGCPDPFEPGESVVWKSGEHVRNLKVSAKRHHGKRMLVSFEGIGDVEPARELSGGILLLPRDRLPPVADGFIWSHEIEGWRCEDPAGATLGAVRLLEETPAGPQLSLTTPAGKEVLVPFVRPIVVAMDQDSRRIVLDLPEGLMDL